MKKLFALVAGLVLVGAGCLGGSKPITGDWVLAFDLPSDWVMVTPYQEEADFDAKINRNDAEVFLQANDATEPAMKVSQLDPRRVIPSEAEMLKDGTFRVEVCSECAGAQKYEYYLQLGSDKYKFIIVDENLTTAEVERIIYSSQQTEAPVVDNGFVE